MHSSKYKREYLLVQQTPLLHFQYTQPGVALRASEVKPMLDRFMLNFIKEHNLDVPDSWYAKVPKGTMAKPFNYKMSIKTDAEPETVKSNNLYFGNMGHDVPPAKALFFKCKNSEGKIVNGVKLELVCFCEAKAKLNAALSACGLPDEFSLNELIGFVLPAFFALTCFGTRSTKGFGSFNVSGHRLTDDYIHLFVPVFYKVSYGTAKPNYSDIMDDIWVISGLMKSGFNFGENSYYKGRALLYLREKTDRNIGADKAFIKQRVLTNRHDTRKSSEEYVKYNEFRFVRAMLGLPQSYTYRASSSTTRKDNVNISPAEENKVKRFASPVRFVPNGFDTYIVPVDIPREMFNAEFKFNSKTIRTPSQAEFNLVGFLDWFAEAFKNDPKLKDFEVNPQMRKMSAMVVKTLSKNLTIAKSAKKAGDGNA